MSANFCPPSQIMPIYYPRQRMNFCSDCGEQVIYFGDMRSWSHVPNLYNPYRSQA